MSDSRTGNIVRNPVAKETPKGRVTAFSIAVTPNRYNPETKKHEQTAPTEFYDVSAWGPLGERCLKDLKRRDRVIVEGDVKESTFQRADGTEGINRAITANEVGPSLLFTDVTISRSHEISGPSL